MDKTQEALSVVDTLKLALEALEGASMHGDFSNGITDPTGTIDEGNVVAGRVLGKAITAIRGALMSVPDGAHAPTEREQPAQQEPVALPEKIYEFVPTPEPAKWHHPECEGECIACLIERVVQEAYGSQGLGYLQRHLTPPPAQRKPLTDEQREEIAKKWRGRNWTVGDIIDAIEAAHGIKE